jgi:hypothetical protein
VGRVNEMRADDEVDKKENILARRHYIMKIMRMLAEWS